MAAPKAPTIGSLIDELAALKAEKAQIEASKKAVEKRIDDKKQEILDRMDAEGTTLGAGKTASARVNETVLPQVKDWDAFYAFIRDNNYFHLLQRRPSTPGCAELFATQEIPGVERFTKRDINLRSL